MSTTRATLLAKVYDRQPDAQREFAEIYLPVVTQYAEQFTDGQDADDIAQQVLVNFCVVTPIRYDRERGLFRHLLMVAVRRRWLDLMRKRKRENTLPINWAERVPEAPAEITDRDLQLAEVRAAYASIRGDLTERTRIMFERVEFGGETAVAVAADLGMTEEAVRAATFRVRTKLREELARRGINSDGFA